MSNSNKVIRYIQEEIASPNCQWHCEGHAENWQLTDYQLHYNPSTHSVMCEEVCVNHEGSMYGIGPYCVISLPKEMDAPDWSYGWTLVGVGEEIDDWDSILEEGRDLLKNDEDQFYREFPQDGKYQQIVDCSEWSWDETYTFSKIEDNAFFVVKHTINDPNTEFPSQILGIVNAQGTALTLNFPVLEGFESPNVLNHKHV